MADRHFVKTHPVKSIKSNKRYWDWAYEHGKYNGEGELTEMVRANPDGLPERNTAPTEAQMLMGEAINHLQGRQKEVYLLLYRYGKSMSEVATVLDISKSAVQMYKTRAVKFLTQYIQGVLANESE